MTPEQIQHILAGPALAPPTGVIPHVTSRGPEQFWFWVTTGLGVGVPGILLLLRTYQKLFVTRRVDISNGIIVAAFVFMIGEIVIGTKTLPIGAGVHQWNVRMRDFFDLLYWMNILEICYAPTILFVKMSILVQYFQIFVRDRRHNMFMYIGTWIVITSSVIFYTVDMFFTIFECTPREKIWNKLLPGGKCINYHALIIATGFFNIISDVAILLLPVKSLWKLAIPTKKKVGITLLFATGLLACIASVMRIVHTFRIVLNETRADVSYNTAWMGLWSYAEMSTGLIVTCILTLPKLFKTMRPQISGLFGSITRPFASLGFNLTSRSMSQSTATDPSIEELKLVKPQVQFSHEYTVSKNHGQMPFEYSNTSVTGLGVGNPTKAQPWQHV